MSQLLGNFDDFGMDSVTLAGPLAAKLRAMREAGFSQTLVAARDLVDHPGGWRAAVQDVRDSGLRVTGMHTLRNFEGLSGQLHDYKVDVAKGMLEMCAALGSQVLLASASISSHATDDLDAIARDLRKLAMLAVPLNIRIAYQPLSRGRVANEFATAWDLVCRADAPNLGLALGVDTLHAMAEASSFDELDLLDTDKLFLVLLADVMWTEPRALDTAAPTPRRVRVFPGEGVQPDAIAELVTRLDALGYRGSYAFDVYNDDYRQIPIEAVAARARRAAVWLGEEVLHRSVPMPNTMRLKAPDGAPGRAV